MSIPGGSISSVFENSGIKSLAQSAISSGTVEMISSKFDSGFEAIGNACHAVFDLVKFDIFINFFQQIGLWFTRFNFPEKFEKMFHAFMDFVSLVWEFVLGITDLQIFYIWSVISVILFVIWLVLKRFDPEPENLGPNKFGWEEHGSLWNLFTYCLVTLLTTLYLPAITACFRVLFCFEGLMFPYELNCYSGLHWLHFAVAIFVFLFIGLYLPYQIYLTINKYQPAPNKFDEAGERYEEDYDKDRMLEDYRQLLAKDQCPYNFLYSGYEYGWSAYKVITMIVKMLLIVPLIPFFTNTLGPACFSLVVVFVYALTSAISSPFILPQDDWIDLSARVTAVLTIALQICVIKEVVVPPYDGIVLNVINIANLVIMILIFVGNLDFVKLFFRSKFGSLKFTPGMAYNPPNERLKRIWQRFWRGMFSSCGTLKPCSERLETMETVFTKYGKKAYKDSLIPASPEIAQARRMCLELEGVDAYFRIEHSNLKQQTCWGRMYITPFPFRVNMIYDDGMIYQLKEEEVITFVRQNFREPNVVNGRKVRQCLRCLDGERVSYPLDIVIPAKDGGPKEEVPIHFTEGILKIKKSANDPFAHGFKVKIKYSDGTYTLPDGRTKTGFEFSAKKKNLGITENFIFTEELRRLVYNESNKSIIDSKWGQYIERVKLYHDDLEEERQEADNILSYNFWQLVYLNDHCPEDELIEYLVDFEQNEEVKTIATLYREDLDGLYSRLNYFDCHPAVALWYCFFDDVYLYNHMIDKIADHLELFDTSNPESLAYHPCSIDELKEKLVEAGLRTKGGGGLFNNEVLDQFAEKLSEECESDFIPKKVPHVSPISSALVADTRCIATPLLTENTTYIASAFASCL